MLQEPSRVKPHYFNFGKQENFFSIIVYFVKIFFFMSTLLNNGFSLKKTLLKSRKVNERTYIWMSVSEILPFGKFLFV